jgi:hypothetical protein
MTRSNSELGDALPAAIRQEAISALSKFPEFPQRLHWDTFSVRVGGEIVEIPTRVYYDPKLIDSLALSSRQKELVDCLLTRHHNGFVRKEHLQRIICSEHIWIPPFVVQLVSEYVIEILQVDQRQSEESEPLLVRAFHSVQSGICCTHRVTSHELLERVPSSRQNQVQ